MKHAGWKSRLGGQHVCALATFESGLRIEPADESLLTVIGTPKSKKVNLVFGILPIMDCTNLATLGSSLVCKYAPSICLGWASRMHPSNQNCDDFPTHRSYLVPVHRAA